MRFWHQRDGIAWLISLTQVLHPRTYPLKQPRHGEYYFWLQVRVFISQGRRQGLLSRIYCLSNHQEMKQSLSIIASLAIALLAYPVSSCSNVLLPKSEYGVSISPVDNLLAAFGTNGLLTPLTLSDKPRAY